MLGLLLGCARSVTGTSVPHPLGVALVATVDHSDGRQRSVAAARFWASMLGEDEQALEPGLDAGRLGASLAAPSTNSPVVRWA